MAPPLVTLLSAEPEIQYMLHFVALTSLSKTDYLLLPMKSRLYLYACEDAEVGDHDKTCFGQKHRDQLLLEFKDYATEVDVDFVRQGCSYESIIATLCESVDTLDEPEAKAFMIWIIGDMQKESTLDFLAASNMFFTEAKKCSVGQPGVNMCSQDSNP
ncbi:PREDICTED: beta-adaptin-like protein C [Brassica oleracea var. oleracea]|uniref:beta-adaptin-like protein C n=1 Tax=Brassica oleracea var. oleracea TaxID=109376 RepID=UPI0006A6C512|nr:PREDICTED: beta-adaptin-like protein C [Brassica oleracea var. oleracea]